MLPPVRLVLVAFSVTFGGSFLYGYHFSVTNPTQSIFRERINDSFVHRYQHEISETEYRVLWSTIAMVPGLVAVLGSSLIPFLVAKFSHKLVLIGTSGLFILAGTLCASSGEYFEIFVLGRIIFGISAGTHVGVQGIYLSEITPIKHRGFIGAFTGLMIEIGFCSGATMGIPQVLGTTEYLSILFWWTIFPSVLCILTLLTIAPSPGSDSNSTPPVKMTERNTQAEPEPGISKEKQLQTRKEGNLGFRALLQDRYSRPGLLIGCLLNTMHVFSGVVAYSNFGTSVLEHAGFEKDVAAIINVAISTGSLFGSVMSICCLDKIGRRPILLGCVATMVVTNSLMVVFLALSDSISVAPYIIVVVSIIFMVVFGGGLASMVWFISTELVPPNAKSAAQSVALSTQYILGFLSGLIFFPLVGEVGAYSFLLFAVPMFLGGIFLFFKLPETKNRSIDEILKQIVSDPKPTSIEPGKDHQT